jgi:hypothetical protein
VHCLARDAGISQTTGYRYLHEGVLAAQAPDLQEVLDLCRAEGMTHVGLDGTLIACDRLAGVRETGNDLWFSQKHKSFGGNIQFLAAPDGPPDPQLRRHCLHRGPLGRIVRTDLRNHAHRTLTKLSRIGGRTCHDSIRSGNRASISPGAVQPRTTISGSVVSH